jgi:hypothetical protein
MSGTPLTRQVAEKALRKLEARDETPKGAAHPIFAIYHEGALVARTGLRRSSNRDIPVPHVKQDLRVSTPFVLGLARCPITKRQWLQELGLVPPDQQESGGDQPPGQFQ